MRGAKLGICTPRRGLAAAGLTRIPGAPLDMYKLGRVAFACAAPSLAMGRSILGSRHARAGPLEAGVVAHG